MTEQTQTLESLIDSEHTVKEAEKLLSVVKDCAEKQKNKLFDQMKRSKFFENMPLQEIKMKDVVGKSTSQSCQLTRTIQFDIRTGYFERYGEDFNSDPPEVKFVFEINRMWRDSDGNDHFRVETQLSSKLLLICENKSKQAEIDDRERNMDAEEYNHFQDDGGYDDEGYKGLNVELIIRSKTSKEQEVSINKETGKITHDGGITQFGSFSFVQDIDTYLGLLSGKVTLVLPKERASLEEQEIQTSKEEE